MSASVASPVDGRIDGRIDGRDPTRVVTRRCIALLVDALLLALIPAATVSIVGNASMRKGVCPNPIPVGRDCLSYRNQVLLVDQHVFLVFFGLLVLLYLVVRAVAWAIDGIALIVPIALWSAWFTPGHRRVGDWVAGTYVIRNPGA